MSNKKLSHQNHTRRLRLEKLEMRRVLAPVTVNTDSDNTDVNLLTIDIPTITSSGGAGPDGVISLREAVAAANNTNNVGGPDEITFASNVPPNIVLTDGHIQITDDLTIIGREQAAFTIQADTGSRIFSINDNDNSKEIIVSMQGLTFTGGDVSGNGGAIATTETLTLDDTQFTSNNASSRGGAIYSSQNGDLTVTNSLFSGNTAISRGGAVVFDSAGTAAFDSVEMTLNSASTGGAFSSAVSTNLNAAVMFTNSTITYNDATANVGGGAGGGIHVVTNSSDLVSSLKITHSTIAENTSALDGGGIYTLMRSNSTVEINDSVVSGNTASSRGGGVYMRSLDLDTVASDNLLTVQVKQTLVSENMAGGSGGGAFIKIDSDAAALIEDSHITGNSTSSPSTGRSEGNGGGLYAYLHHSNANVTAGKKDPEFTVSRTTIDNNLAEVRGGGIFVCAKFPGIFALQNSTVSGNSTRDTSMDLDPETGYPTGVSYGRGGGIFAGRLYGNIPRPVEIHLRNVTVTKNTSDDGGGIAIEDEPHLSVNLANTIVSENTDYQSSPDNIFGRLNTASAKHNLIGMSTILNYLTGLPATIDVTNLISDTPKLNSLADNGGTVRLGITGYYPPTHLPMSDSDVIDRGSDAFAVNPLTTVAYSADQRGEGFTRYYDDPIHANEVGLTDIGAIERLVTSLPTVINVIIADGNPSDNGTIAYDLEDFLTGTQDGEEQLEPVPVPKLDTFLIQFSEDVSAYLDANVESVGLLGLLEGHVPDYINGTYDYDHTTNTAIWQFEALHYEEHYLLYLKDDITNAAGRHLDGEWANPASYTNPPSSAAVSNFATGNGSGNGAEGGDFAFVFRTLLFGDADNDGSVSGSDLLAVTNNFSSTGPADGLLLGDADDDGAVAGSDLLAVTNNFGSFLKDDIALLLDLDNDGDVDAEDFAEYLSNSRDLNGDGNIGDAADDAIRDGYEDFWMAFGDLEVELAYAWL